MKRGRKSQADLGVVPIGPRIGRPSPPEDLTDAQKREWRAIVAALPADWFGQESLPVLADYCRHAERSRKLSALLDRVDVKEMLNDGNFAEYDKVASAAERETRAVLACARALRLTHQARYDAAKAGRAMSARGAAPVDWASAIQGAGDE